MEVLGYFDDVKVSPPLFKTDLSKTLDSLKEKKEYFETAKPEDAPKEKDEEKP